MPRRFQPEEIQAMWKDRSKGMTFAALSKKYKRNPNIIAKKLRTRERNLDLMRKTGPHNLANEALQAASTPKPIRHLLFSFDVFAVPGHVLETEVGHEGQSLRVYIRKA